MLVLCWNKVSPCTFLGQQLSLAKLKMHRHGGANNTSGLKACRLPKLKTLAVLGLLGTLALKELKSGLTQG